MRGRPRSQRWWLGPVGLRVFDTARALSELDREVVPTRRSEAAVAERRATRRRGAPAGRRGRSSSDASPDAQTSVPPARATQVDDASERGRGRERRFGRGGERCRRGGRRAGRRLVRLAEPARGLLGLRSVARQDVQPGLGRDGVAGGARDRRAGFDGVDVGGRPRSTPPCSAATGRLRRSSPRTSATTSTCSARRPRPSSRSTCIPTRCAPG